MDQVRARKALLAVAIASLVGLGAHHSTAARGDEPGSAVSVEQLYGRDCAGCHGLERGGGFGPALSGPAFAAKWAKKGRGALGAYIRETMPPANPGSLSPRASQDLAALLLSDADAVARKTADASGEVEIVGLGNSETNHDAVYDATLESRRQVLQKLKTVTDAMLQDPPAGDWLTPRRTLDSFGHSPLDQINRDNVADLELAWSLALPNGTNSINPLAHDGVLFINSGGTVLAIDGDSGDVLWTFSRTAEIAPPAPPLTQPRGMTLYGDSLIVPTMDNHLIALDMRTGNVVWDTAIAPSGGRLRITAAPVVVRGKVIQGIAGCGLSGECFVVALDAATGEEAWRFATIARAGTRDGDTWAGLPDDKRWGGSVWSSPSYDFVTGLLYVGVAQTYNIAPLMASGRAGRENAALYMDSTLALDPDTGKLVWHYQHMEREVWDLDWAFERTVMTLPTSEGPRRVVATMGKLGILDALDARTGEYLFSYDLGLQNLVTGIDPETGRKRTDPALEPELDKAKAICPFATGVRNWPATSFDPDTGLLYVPYLKACMDFVWKPGGGFDISYGLKVPTDSNGKFGGLAAIDVAAKKLAWKNEYRGPAQSAALSTGGGVVFDGGRDRFFRASDSETGKLLWQLRLDQVPSAMPISFNVDGAQRVAVTTGAGNPNEVTSRSLTPEIENAGPGVRLWVFKLRDPKRS